VPHVRAPTDAREEDLLPKPSVPGARKQPRKKLLLLTAIGVLVLGGAGVAYRFFMAEPPAPPPITKKNAPAPTQAKLPAAATVTPAQNQPQVVNAKEAIAERLANEKEIVAALTPGSKPAEKAAPPPPPVMATEQLAPGVTATTAVSNVEGAASVAFRTWVANARINGVFEGTPARALINGRMVRAGQEVDDTLGITFAGVKADRNLLIFRDRSGATVERRF
jgi:hypothetical protein